MFSLSDHLADLRPTNTLISESGSDDLNRLCLVCTPSGAQLSSCDYSGKSQPAREKRAAAQPQLAIKRAHYQSCIRVLDISYYLSLR